MMIKNLRLLFQRFFLSTMLNVVGLTVAFSVFIVLLMQVYYDRTYNSSIPDINQLYLVHYTTDGVENDMSWGPEFARLRNASAGIEEASFICPFVQNSVFKIGGNYFDYPMQQVDTSYLKMVGCEMLAGRIQDLSGKNKVFVPESFARKYFGRIDVVGEAVEETGTLVVGGVYRDFPKNCMAGNNVYNDVDVEHWIQNSRTWSFLSLVKFDNPETGRQIVADLDAFAANSARLYNTWRKKTYNLIPVADARYGYETHLMPSVDSRQELLRIAMALIVLVIAGINFTNFAVALAPLRLRSVNTHKVFGATRFALVRMLTVEAVAIAIVAFALAVGLLAVLSGTPLSSLTEAGIDLVAYWPVLVLSLAVALAVGLVAGVYPAWFMTRVSPSVALKGNFGLTRKGVAMRNLLIGFQYFASFVLIALSLAFWKQRDYMVNADYGFDRDRLITFDIKKGLTDKIEGAMADINRIPGVEACSYSCFLLGAGNNIMGWTRSLGDEERVQIDAFPVSKDFLKTVGIEVEEGRDFLDGDSTAMVFSRVAQKRWPEFISPGSQLPFGEVAGIVGDVQYLSMNWLCAKPMAFVIAKGQWDIPNFGYVRVAANSDMFAVMDAVRKVVKRYEPEYPLDVKFYDERLEQAYDNEQRQVRRVSAVSFIAVLICVVGVFGLVVFDSEYRRREIAVRKVFGSTTNHIVGMFVKKYMVISVVSFLLSLPLSVYASDYMLAYLPHKAEIGWGIYAVSFVVLSLVTMITVVVQCLRVAKANPVESLKYE